MTERSPTPWTYEESGLDHYGNAGDFPFNIRSADDWNIAAVIGDVPDLPAEANAAFIVHAVNLHDEMVEALREAQSALAMLTEPDAIRSTRVHEAWAIAVAAELKCRSALSKSNPTQKGD